MNGPPVFRRKKIRALANVRCAEFNTGDYIFITVLSYRYFVFFFVTILLLFYCLVLQSFVCDLY